jgi:hypothetical protein
MNKPDVRYKNIKVVLVWLFIVFVASLIRNVTHKSVASELAGLLANENRDFAKTTESPNSADAFDIGGSTILLPAPEGFFRYDGKSAKVDQCQQSIAGADRLVATFSSESDLGDVLSDAFPALKRYFLVTSVRKVEGYKVTPILFADLKKILRGEIDSLVTKNQRTVALAPLEADASKALSKAVQSPVDVKVGELIPLGVFDETPESICFSAFGKIRYDVRQGEHSQVDRVCIVAGSEINVRQRVVTLTCCSTYNSELDIEWVRTQLKKWRDAVVAANAK